MFVILNLGIIAMYPMHYVEVFDKNQIMMETWDSTADLDSTERLIDAFVIVLTFRILA